MVIPRVRVMHPVKRLVDELDLGSHRYLRICGDSGSGKSTYLNGLAIELRRIGKSILYQSQSRRYPKGYTPEEYARLINTHKEFYEAVRILDVDLKKDFSLMSGGELQRIALAECLVSRCQYILLDETFNAIDNGRIDQVVELMDAFSQRSDNLIIYISHVDIQFPNEEKLYFDKH